MTSRSDTVKVYPCGRTVVDIAKLFAKPHIQALMAAMLANLRLVVK